MPVAETADPLGGSFYVESLTASMEDAVKEIMAHIDEMGGSVRAIEEGFMQDVMDIVADPNPVGAG